MINNPAKTIKNRRSFVFPSLVIFCLLHSLCFSSTVSFEEKKLIQLANQGEMSQQLRDQFYRYSEARANSQVEIPDGFWQWLSNHEDIRRGLLLGLYPEYNKEVVTHLWQLKTQHGEQFDKFHDLALALSFVYGQAKRESIRPDWTQWVAAGRDVPSCDDSFLYYIQNHNQMLQPLDEMPWPLLLHLADNDVPISERKWALQKYKNNSLDDLSKLHKEPKYITGDEATKYKNVPNSMSLPTIFERGGVCSQQGYYASRVLKCIGVPSVRLLERKHAYEGWISKSSEYSAQYGGAVGRKNGYYLCPLTRTKKVQYEFSMLGAAMNVSTDSYLDAMMACHIIDILPGTTKKECVVLLDKVLELNPYCADAWKKQADLCAAGLISTDEGWGIYKRLRKQLPEYPGIVCYVVQQVMDSALDTALNHTKNMRDQTQRNLMITSRWLKSIDREFLAEDILELSRQYTTVTRRSVGTLKQQVINTADQQLMTYVWQVLPDTSIPVPCRFQVRIKHAAAGRRGALYAVAWADTDQDSLPDTKIGMSGLLEAEAKGQWSTWEFSTKYPIIYVGIETRTKAVFYYQQNGQLKGYAGLSDRVFYTRDPLKPPTNSVRRRYSNIQVDIITENTNSKND